MILDVDQHTSYITAPDNRNPSLQEATLPAPAGAEVIQEPINTSDKSLSAKRKARNKKKYSGLNLAKLGLKLLSLTIIVSAVPYYGCLYTTGRYPNVHTSFAITGGIMMVISLILMVWGTHESTPGLKKPKRD